MFDITQARKKFEGLTGGTFLGRKISEWDDPQGAYDQINSITSDLSQTTILIFDADRKDVHDYFALPIDQSEITPPCAAYDKHLATLQNHAWDAYLNQRGSGFGFTVIINYPKLIEAEKTQLLRQIGRATLAAN